MNQDHDHDQDQDYDQDQDQVPNKLYLFNQTTAAIYYSCLFINIDNTKYPTTETHIALPQSKALMPAQRYTFKFDTSLVAEKIKISRDEEPVLKVTFDIGRNGHTQHTLIFTDELYSIQQAITAVEAYFNQPLPCNDLAALKKSEDILPNIHDFYPYRGSALGTFSNLRNRIIWCEYNKSTLHLRIHLDVNSEKK